MKFTKENIKQISLIVTGILLIGIGFLNSSLDMNKENIGEFART